MKDDGNRAPASTSTGSRGRRCFGSARLGEILVRDGFISSDDLAAALREQEAGSEWRVGRLLVQQGAIDEATLVHVVAQQFDLDICDPRANPPNASVIDALPRDAALQLKALPMARNCGRLAVAVSDPPTRSLKTALERAAGGPVQLLLCRADALSDALEYWYGTEPSDARRIDPVECGPTPCVIEPPASEESPTTDRVVRWLLESAFGRNASSIRVEVDESATWIRFGTKGETHDELRLPPASGAILVRRIRRASGLAAEAKAIATGRMVAALGDTPVAVAVDVVSALHRTVVSLRIDRDDEPTTRFEELGFDSTGAASARGLICGRTGLIVVAAETAELAGLVSNAFVEEARRHDRRVVASGPSSADAPTGVIYLPADNAASITIALHAASWLEADVIVARTRIDRGILAPAIVVTADDRTVVAVCEGTRVADSIVALYGAAGGALLAVTLRAVVRVAGDAENPATEFRTITDEMRAALRDPDGP